MMKNNFMFLMIFVPLATLLGACQALSGLDLGRENIPCGPLRHIGRATAEHPQVITLTAWARSDVNICNMASIPVWSAEKHHPWVGIEAERFNVSPSRLHDLVEERLLEHSAPDIFIADNQDDVLRFARQGKIAPLDKCIEYSDNIFEGVMPFILKTVTHDEQIWAIPVDVGYRLLYYDKPKLQMLGWADEQIESLSTAIQTGEFTLDDLTATAEEAIALGIVDSGYGFVPDTGRVDDFWENYIAFGGELYDHKTQQLVFSTGAFERTLSFNQFLFEKEIRLKNFQTVLNRTFVSEYLRTDALAARRALFWKSGSTDIPEFDPRIIYGEVDSASETYLSEVGVSVHPSGKNGTSGKTLAYFDFWVLTESLQDNPDKFQAACRILASSLEQDTLSQHLRVSGRVAASQLAEDAQLLQENLFQASIYPFWAYAWTMPETVDRFDAYRQSYEETLDAIADNQLSLDAAPPFIIAKLKSRFGNEIEIRQ